MPFIYAMCEPGTGNVRYVGKANSVKARMKAHRNDKRTTRKCRWLAKLRRDGLEPTLIILEEAAPEAWEEAERKWIAYYRVAGNDLTNHTDGGEGTSGLDKDAREKLAAFQRGQWADPKRREILLGYARSPDRRKHISESLRGKPKSAEHLARLPQNQKGFKHSEAFRRKVSAAGVGRVQSEVTKDKIRAANRGNQHGVGNRSRKGQVQGCEERLRKSKVVIGIPKSEGHRKNIAAAARRLWEKRKAAGIAGFSKKKIVWPSLEVIQGMLRKGTIKGVAKQLGVKPGTLSAYLHRRRRGVTIQPWRSRGQ